MLSLGETSRALQDATQRQIEAMDAGADQATLDRLEQLRALNLQRNDYNSYAIDQIRQLAQIEGWGSAQVVELERQRQAYLQRMQEQIDAVRDVEGGVRVLQDGIITKYAPGYDPTSDPRIDNVAQNTGQTVEELQEAVVELKAAVGLLQTGFQSNNSGREASTRRLESKLDRIRSELEELGGRARLPS